MFTTDWWTANIPKWQQQFPMATWAPDRQPPMRMLEVGTFEGRSADWFLSTLLGNAESHLTCVDTFAGSHEHRGRDLLLGDLEARCRTNLARFGDKVTIMKGSSWEVLRAMPRRHLFDVIYIDGEHHAASVLEDAVLAFPLLKVGGRMVFDDFGARPDHGPSTSLPRKGLQAFTSAYQDRIVVDDDAGWQLFLTKTSEACGDPACVCARPA
jgi:predicted O-methyltransferase YrrM